MTLNGTKSESIGVDWVGESVSKGMCSVVGEDEEAIARVKRLADRKQQHRTSSQDAGSCRCLHPLERSNGRWILVEGASTSTGELVRGNHASIGAAKSIMASIGVDDGEDKVGNVKERLAMHFDGSDTRANQTSYMSYFEQKQCAQILQSNHYLFFHEFIYDYLKQKCVQTHANQMSYKKFKVTRVPN